MSRLVRMQKLWGKAKDAKKRARCKPCWRRTASRMASGRSLGRPAAPGWRAPLAAGRAVERPAAPVGPGLRPAAGSEVGPEVGPAGVGGPAAAAAGPLAAGGAPTLSVGPAATRGAEAKGPPPARGRTP